CERCQPCAGGPACRWHRAWVYLHDPRRRLWSRRQGGGGDISTGHPTGGSFRSDLAGTATLNALPLAVSASAITAVMPSNAPLGLASNEGIPFPNSRRLSGCFRPRSNNEQYDLAAIRQLAKTHRQGVPYPMEVCRGYVEAQMEYAAQPRNGSKVLQY